jgi:predicted metal-dependent phosphoesterase TrpH
MTEVRRKPIETEDDDGVTYISFDDDHTIRDIIRYLLSTGVDAEELCDHINDPELLADAAYKEKNKCTT